MEILEADQVEGKALKGGLVFIKEVAKYFMDFLETDFHKRKNPKRSIQYQSNNNLLVGVNLNKYPTFNNDVVKAINHAFEKEALTTLGKGVYRSNIPSNLVDLIKVLVKKIQAKQLSEVVKKISLELEKNATLYKKDYDQAVNGSIEAASKIIKNDFVLPFVQNLEKPLENLKLVDENIIFLMEEELTSVFVKQLENKITEILKSLIADEELDIKKSLEEVIIVQEVRLSITTFFESFQVGDLFAEVYEMERNRTILDKQEFYLYFCDITYNNSKYPIFYIPFVTSKQDDKLLIEFDFQVYINKKALEFITQEYNQEKGNQGSLQSTAERIIYLSQHQNDFSEVVNHLLTEISNFFGLDNTIDIRKTDHQRARSLFVSISNSFYIALFDKSDEALVNDYEEILKLLIEGDNVIAGGFNKLIDDFIHNNPQPFNPGVEEDWDNMDTGDRLVFNSPIPLNSEQLQILSAIKRDGCKYIIVEGPPGTGKSHTITAIAFDAILKNQSVLVLSDKKEALDVVEDKITETMNKVRHDKSFQNPILRLGKTGSTYSQILAAGAIENTKTHIRAIKNDKDAIEESIEKIQTTIKEDLEAEVLAYQGIDLSEVEESIQLESFYQENGFPIDIDEALNNPESAIDLAELRKSLSLLKDELVTKPGKEEHSNLYNRLHFKIEQFNDIASFKKYLWLLEFLSSVLNNIKESAGASASSLAFVGSFSDSSLPLLNKYVDLLKKEKNPVFGYLFKKTLVESVDKEINQKLGFAPTFVAHKNLSTLEKLASVFGYAQSQRDQLEGSPDFHFDYLRFIHEALMNESLQVSLTDLTKIAEEIEYIETCVSKYPNIAKKTKITTDSFKTLCDNKLLEIPEADFDRLVRFIGLRQKINKDFSIIPKSNYASYKKNIEDLVTTQMTYLLDSRVIEFYENNKATARAIRDIIKSKRRFPKEEFLKLKEAFPCILAGIRDYAEYIPLEPEIFDLVIIDEASQVSIAQAFPALLRAKKVLILGDKKQFSNVKTAQARTDTNREYLNNLRDSFFKNVSKEATKVVKLEKFNIKTSILEFFEFISNYNTQLLKHFRGYKEIISYSNKYFYQDNLQVMKIRGKAIDEVIKFTVVKHDGKQEISQNTNTLEAEYIFSELKKIKDEGIPRSVGIITPHTNQQKLLVEMLSKVPEREYYYDTLQLKIMTFDTCQGEERDVIYYSMVATTEDDKLWGVFIKNLADVNVEEDGKIKAQRLNVGLSRAKECMHFILSKPIQGYSGSIGEALQHYKYVLDEAKKERSVQDVDQKSKMEPAVMNWFYQTKFWKDHKETTGFFPQFELGKYLKQLDKTYQHPNYEVDFLVVYNDELHKEHKIIIEYDGFQEHFVDAEGINKSNYEDYYSEDDIYRERVLESYGYKFIRINKFNIGEDPISTLNGRLESAVQGSPIQNSVISKIHSTIEGLQNGDMKECPKCKEVRPSGDFRDARLVTGYGRFCKYCKGFTGVQTSSKVKEYVVAQTDLNCPRCNSKMLLRTGRYGKFYGCSRFPYCKGTRQYSS